MKNKTDKIIIDKIIEVLKNGRLTDTEIIIKSKLPITLEGLWPYLKKHFKREVISTGKKLNGIEWTDKGIKTKKFNETITYWSLYHEKQNRQTT